MRKIFDIAVLVVVSSIFGQYTPEGTKYSTAVDQVRRQYFKTQRDYVQYRWTLIDVTQYPYWCANSSLNRSKGTVVTVSEKGATIRTFTDPKKVEHIMVPAVGYMEGSHTRTYKIFYFYSDSTGAWVKEKEPTETVVGVKEYGGYYYCLE